MVRPPTEHPDVPMLRAESNAEILMASVNGGSHPCGVKETNEMSFRQPSDQVEYTPYAA